MYVYKIHTYVYIYNLKKKERIVVAGMPLTQDEEVVVKYWYLRGGVYTIHIKRGFVSIDGGAHTHTQRGAGV